MYGDIVRVDVVDTYGDLSLKTLKLFATLPSKIDADFYFKIDDDVAVNVDALAHYLRERRTQGNLYVVCSPFERCIKLLAGEVSVSAWSQAQPVFKWPAQSALQLCVHVSAWLARFHCQEHPSYVAGALA